MAADVTFRSLSQRLRFRLAARVAFLTALVVLGSAFFLYRRFTDPAALVPLAQNYLQQFAHGAVRIDGASFSWLDGLHLYGVTVEEPETEHNIPTRTGDSANDEMNPVFSCREIAIRFDPWRLLLGDPRVEAITLIRPKCLIVRVAGETTSDIAGLKLIQPPAFGDSRASRPAIELRDALFQVIHRDAHAVREVDSLSVTVRGRPSARDPDIYELVWRGSVGEVTSGKATLNFRDGSLTNINGGLPWLSLEAVMIVINAQYDAAGAWSDLLGLQGRVRVRDYYINAVDGVVSPFAIVDLEHTALSIPLNAEERDAPLADRYLRFDDVHGTIQLTRDTIKMTFDGKFDTASCRVSASLKTAPGRITSLNDVPFDATIDVSSLELPEPDDSDTPAETRLFRWVPVLKRIYDEFEPSGIVDMSIDIGKLPGPEPFNLRRARLIVKQARAKYARFPYELSNLSGVIEVAPDGVNIDNLCGGHGPAHVCINGSLDQPNRCAGGSIEITGEHVTIDESLLGALPESVRRAIDRFRPSGTVDLNVTMKRSGCVDHLPQPWNLVTDILLRDLSAAYDVLPIPVSHISGRVVVKGNELTLHDLRGRTGDASIAADGRIITDRGGDHEVDLTLITTQMSLDEAFIQALPRAASERLRSFHPSGLFNATTRIRQDRSQPALTFDSEIDLLGVNLDHESIPATLTGLKGRLYLTPERLEILSARGNHGLSTVDLTGAIDLSSARLEHLNIQAINVILDEDLKKSLADNWSVRLGDWGIDRLAAVNLGLKPQDSESSKLAISGSAELRGSTVTHARLRAPLTEVDADLVFAEGSLNGSLHKARLHGATLSAGFSSDTNSNTPLALHVNAQGLSLTDMLQWLPRGSSSPPEHGNPVSASINLEMEYSGFHAPGNAADSSSSFSGTAVMTDLSLPDASLASEKPIEIYFKGTKDSNAAAWRAFGKLNAPRVNYHGLPIEHLEGAWQASVNPNGEMTIGVTNLHGLLYGGDAIASVSYVHAAAQRSYDIAAMVRGVDITPLAARWTNRDASSRGVEVSGRLDAHVSLAGDLNDASTRRGEGRMEVREGRLYRLPVLWAILQVINLNVAADDVLEEAETDFFIEGNRLLLEGIHLRGTSVELYGNGVLSWPDQGVDLRLINTSPSLWDSVPVVGSAVRRVSRELLEFRVTGPIQQPTVRTATLRGITDEIRSLFQTRRSRPLPPQR